MEHNDVSTPDYLWRNAGVRRHQTGLLLFFSLLFCFVFPCVNAQPVRGELGNRIAGQLPVGACPRHSARAVWKRTGY